MSNSKGKKILIVDDEPDVITYLTTFLEDNGFEVISASDGHECMEAAIKSKPDLITLDMTMPNKSGVRAYRDLEDNEETKNIPVIIITGLAGDFEKFISTRKQVEPPLAYFEKPIDRDKLLAKIKETI